MYKKAWCTCKVVVLLIKPIVFVTFSLPSASLDLKVPIVYRHNPSRNKAISRLTFDHQNGNNGCLFRFYPVSRTRQSFPLPVDFVTKTAAGFAQSVER